MYIWLLLMQLKEVVATVDNCLVLGMFNIMDSLLKKYERAEDQEPLSPEDIEGAREVSNCKMLKALIIM